MILGVKFRSKTPAGNPQKGKVTQWASMHTSWEHWACIWHMNCSDLSKTHLSGSKASCGYKESHILPRVCSMTFIQPFYPINMRAREPFLKFPFLAVWQCCGDLPLSWDKVVPWGKETFSQNKSLEKFSSSSISVSIGLHTGDSWAGMSLKVWYFFYLSLRDLSFPKVKTPLIHSTLSESSW